RDLKSETSNLKSRDWPTYRGNNARSGSVRTNIPPILNEAWKADIGGRLSGLAVAEDKVLVAQVDAHRVHALDAVTGEQLWRFTAGARVDSPPTFYNGLALFGSADGHIYCLRASDGELVWRFLAAPQQISVVAFDQLESVWPIHGSVLVKNDVVYAAAGRCSYLDGGIMIYGLDPVTGKAIVRRHIESEHVGAMDPPLEAAGHASTIQIRQNTLDCKTFLAPDRSDAFSMHGATTDILVADKTSIYMRHMRFNDRLEMEDSGRPHLYSTSRLLDDWEHNRSYWILGTGDIARTPVAYPWIIRSDLAVPFGLMMAFDDKTVWAVRRGWQKKGIKSGPGVLALPRPDPSDKVNHVPDFQKRTTGKSEFAGFLWKTDMPKRARAMLCAGDILVIAGRDAKGGFLQTLSAHRGTALDEQPLEASPIWDGLAVAAGRLYAALENGTVICLGGR
ncbi:MAG: PQQ-like beta-propeller repeat protein, partial [Phycisphaerales bacterium]